MHDAMYAVRTAKDFDFLFGRWNVRNRRLRERLAGSDEWEEFAATSVARPLLDGLGNEDEFRTDHDGGMIGMSFRFFDASTGQWAIYWADSRRCGVLDPPVFGSFSGGVGRLRGRGHVRGRPIVVRFTWSRHRHLGAALGAGLLPGRRRDLGDELDHGLHARGGRR